MPPNRYLACLFLAAIAVVTPGCGRVVDPEFPLQLDDRLILFAALNPDSAGHPVLVWPVNDADTLQGTEIKMYRAGDGTSGFDWDLVAETGQLVGDEVCSRVYGNVHKGSWQCLVPTVILDDSVSYRVEVSAQDRATAWGVAVAVGAFEVDTALLSRSGAESTLSASWTASLAAHRYIVSLRRYWGGNVFHGVEGWYVEVADTSITTLVPDDAIRNAIRPLTLDVAAFDEHLHAFITSGNGGSAFSVPPVQNVVGGFGVVGSVRYRSLAVTER
jgi:hypothetical protein